MSMIFDEQRAELVRTLRAKGIRDERVLAAVGAVPRERFIHAGFTHSPASVYADTALPIGNGQTISQPYTVAYMTSLLGVQAGQKILEIGTGSGYQATILAALGAQVLSIERLPELFDAAQATFTELGVAVWMRLGDGTLGWPEQSPFHGIIVTAGAPDVPPALTEQLIIGGRLVIPVGSAESQTLYSITRTGDATFDVQEWRKFRFVPLVGAAGWNDEEDSEEE
jgi:protein-L-isoaspartate(D-aspartate) O-methyltransferase